MDMINASNSLFLCTGVLTPLAIDTLIIVGAITEQPAVLMAWSLIHADAKQWWAITACSFPAQPVRVAAAPASILDGGSVIVVGEGRLVNIFFFFFGLLVYCNLLWKWGKRSDSQCDKCLKCSHQHEWTADLMECLSVMYATITAKTKADIYHLWGSWDLQGPACPPIRLEFLGIPKALNEPGKLPSFWGRGSGRIKMKWMKNTPDKLLNF